MHGANDARDITVSGKEEYGKLQLAQSTLETGPNPSISCHTYEEERKGSDTDAIKAAALTRFLIFFRTFVLTAAFSFGNAPIKNAVKDPALA